VVNYLASTPVVVFLPRPLVRREYGSWRCALEARFAGYIFERLVLWSQVVDRVRWTWGARPLYMQHWDG
jgi:hypothetical protein